METINEQKNFSVLRSVGGDYYIENNDGERVLVLSPNGSTEHERAVQFLSTAGDESLAVEFEKNR